MNAMKGWVAATAMVTLTGTAQAALVFQGRLANNTASSTCTVSGPDKCTSFYNTTLDITILNNWNIGPAAALDATRALVAQAGQAATGLTGWVLPTDDGSNVASAQNQYASIWNDVGGTLAGLLSQFDGVQTNSFGYWSGTAAVSPPDWSNCRYVDSGGYTSTCQNDALNFGVAVRAGDVASSSVPEPQSLALALLAFGAALGVRRRRPG